MRIMIITIIDAPSSIGYVRAVTVFAFQADFCVRMATMVLTGMSAYGSVHPLCMYYVCTVYVFFVCSLYTAFHNAVIDAVRAVHVCAHRYGDDMAYENSDAYVSEILALVRQQNIHQCNETQGILLEELEFKHMYDACIYFISPHQLKPRDLKFMSSISKAVPVIPVIAKADCMTEEERQVFRSHINASLQKPNFSGTTAALARLIHCYCMCACGARNVAHAVQATLLLCMLCQVLVPGLGNELSAVSSFCLCQHSV